MATEGRTAAIGEPVLDVSGLKTHFLTPEGRVRAVDGVDMVIGKGPHPRRARGVRQRQVRHRAVGDAPDPPARGDRRRPHHPGRQGPPRHERGGDARDPRQGHLHDLPGAHDLAEPGLHARRPDRRGVRAPPRLQPRRGHGRRRRHAGAGGHPEPEVPRERLPAPVLRRHAPARDDRHGPRLPAEAADRRRAHHRPGRDHPGADPRPAC